jgi:hypothetical protein
LKDSLETGLRNPTSNIDPKRLGDFLYRTVINGEKVDPNHLNSSILNKQTSLNKNFARSVDAATKLTSNLDAILTTSEQMLKVFGVKNLPTPVKETMKAVKKVNQVLTVVQGAAMGYATGGPVGAVAGFASSGGLDLISGGGSGDAKLDEISRKLDMVLENQVKIMQMQVATMNMIKELAVMVDQYHQKEMAALAELKDYSLVELEMEKASLNKDIRACERIISYQLASIWKKFDYSTNSFHSLNNIEGIRERFTASITGIQDIRRIMTSLEANAYSTCQTGIAEAFGGNEASENPLLAIFTTKENENLYNFQETTYLPLVRSLEYFANTNNFDIVPLHVPTAKFDTLNLKHAYIEYARTNGNTNGNTRDNYELNHLVSVKSLERYLGNLLILNPILELDKDVWQKNYQEIISTYIENSNTENNQNSRSHFFLNNALKLVQSSIAQEALLAGEPLIVSLRDSYKDELFSMVECTDIKRADIPATEYPFFCSLRSNLLLLKNIVHYQLKSESVKENFMAQYETALQKKDVASISKLLAMNVPADRIVLSEDKENKTFVASIKIPNPNKEADGTNPHVFVKLPSVEELKAGQIMYSENMSRLIKMQSLILDAIEKVAPVKRNYEDKDLLKLILAGA